ncbi:MAG: hypothetical protein IH961_06990 [Chloroflexi bacterium]|nr:hypothetical protein [Chloroflexota bacterium]
MPATESACATAAVNTDSTTTAAMASIVELIGFLILVIMFATSVPLIALLRI